MKDECFIRGEVPMTKSEIRAISIDKLNIMPTSIVYDIGAGTGSVSIEAAMKASCGHVYAFECKEEACELIEENKKKHNVGNLTVVKGKAPAVLAGLPKPDCVFVGGTRGEMEEILDTVWSMNPQATVVMNLISLENLAKATAYFERRNMEPEIVCVQVSRGEKLGNHHLMKAQNPIYILTVSKCDGVTVDCGETPRIMFAAPSSGSGKTVITTGLLALLKNRGCNLISFKCGPDYIDPMFHSQVLGVPGYNLDSFFLPPDELCELFVKKASGHDLAVLEGVMGYYDGIGGNTTKASSYEVAAITGTPVILIVDGKGSSISIVATIKGFLSFRPDSQIKGVILNRTKEAVGERLREEIEALGVTYLGAVPECDAAKLESRHLGLTLPGEQKELAKSIDSFAKELEKYVDVEKLLQLANKGANLPETTGTPTVSETGDISMHTGRMAVAMDQAFCFYYRDNLEFLENLGYELVYFSPMNDKELPPSIDGILIGGGYPEIYAKELSSNTSMLNAIKEAYEKGIKIIGECGGFMYLHQTIEGTDGKHYPMVGIIPGDSYKTDKLSRFGYITLSDENGEIKGHEFHYWDSTAPGDSMHGQKPLSNRGWDCMYVTDHLLAGFPHLYYASSPKWIAGFLQEEV